MGDVQSNIGDKSKLDQLLSTYVQSSGSHSSLFSNDQSIYLHRYDPQNILILREFVYGGESLFEIGRNQILRRSQLKHPNLPEVAGIFNRSSGDWCSHVHILTVLFQQQTTSLSLQMKQRGCSVHSPGSQVASPVAPFSEMEVINIISGVADAQVCLIKNLGLVMADIHPDNIQFDQFGQVKLQDVNIYSPDSYTGYLRMVHTHTHRSPLSPEQLKDLSLRNVRKEETPEKSSVFSLGLIILGATTGVSFEYFIDFGQFKIKFNLIQEHLQTMQYLGISRMMISFIGNMLNEEPRMRPTFQLIQNTLEKQTQRLL